MPQEVNYFDIDHWIVYAFLVGILYVGLRVGRGIKDMNDFAIAGKSYGTTTLVLTFLATGVGAGSTLGQASDIFSDGIIMLIAGLGPCIAVLFICYYIIPRMVKPGDSISIGDLMGKFYGENVQIFTGVIGILFATGIVAAQTLALGFVFEALLGVDKGIGISIGGTIMVLYSAMGGVRSVTITDVIQFAVLIVIVPLIAGAATNKAGGMAEIFDALPPEKWLIWQHEKFNYYSILFLLFAIPASNLDPMRVQRMLMARDREQRQRMFLTELQVAIPFNFMVALVGLSALTLYPELNPKNVFPHMIAQSMPVVLKGLSIAGILAVIMSTADSCLNTGSIMLVHDVLSPLRKRQNLALDELYWVRVVTLFLGFGAMFVAYFSTNIITLLFYTISLYAPLITIPFVAGLIGMKVDTRSFFNAAV
ncbi:MAG: sodium:solute symporter family protein, partial [Bacteroidota bacterium]